MITKAFYTLDQAAATLRMPPEELAAAIKSGRLKANFLGNLGTYMIARDDLMNFMKSKKDWKGLRKELRPRVLIVDRDSETTTLLQTELESGLDVDARLATSEGDIFTLLDQYVPDLIAIHIGATLRRRDQIREALTKAKAKHAKLIVYHRYGAEFLEAAADMREHIESLQADAIVALGTKVRPLVDKIAEFLRPNKK